MPDNKNENKQLPIRTSTTDSKIAMQMNLIALDLMSQNDRPRTDFILKTDNTTKTTKRTNNDDEQPDDNSTTTSTETNLQQKHQLPASKQSMDAKISTEFKKNMFIVDESKPIITTDEPPEQIFEIISTLGNGSSGLVTKMLHKPSNMICAVKQMRRSGNDEENKRIYMDLQIILNCKCDNIVCCYGYFIKDTEVWICMESMTTCFDKLIRKYKKPLPEKFLGAVAVAVLKALGYLKESHMIIHRDVKPSNILINKQGHIKLCDFGISGRLVDSLARTKAAGCLRYMAPERVDPELGRTYDVRSDVWSLGLTLIELATTKRPYDDCNTEFQIMQRVIFDEPLSLPNNMEFSEECRSFVSACLTKKVKDRPKYDSLVQHEFILKHKDTKISLEDLNLDEKDFDK